MLREPDRPNKKKLVDQLQSYLAQELSELLQRAEQAGSESLDPRAEEIQRLLLMYRFLPVRSYSEEDVICPAGLVELEFNGRRAYYFIVPQGGGLITELDGQPVQVITPQSPLGEALMGKRVGSEVRIEMAGGARSYKVVGYS